jgi:hypothetical protein
MFARRSPLRRPSPGRVHRPPCRRLLADLRRRSPPSAPDDLYPLAWQQCPRQVRWFVGWQVREVRSTPQPRVLHEPCAAGCRDRLQQVLHVDIGPEALSKNDDPISADPGTLPAGQANDDERVTQPRGPNRRSCYSAGTMRSVFLRARTVPASLSRRRMGTSEAPRVA